jgi:hypothetical protein
VRGDLEPTHAEMLALIEADPRLRDAAEFAAKARQDVKSVRPSTWGMAWLLFAGINDLAAVAFLARARDGADIGVGHPAHTLRARIYRAREMQERLTEWEQLALFCIAWNHFQAGTQVVRLNLPRGGLTPKNFPEPK